MLDEWFELKYDLPVLKTECRNVEYLKKIYTRDNGDVTSEPGGKSVRVKKTAAKEIAYIYFTLSTNHFQGYKGKQRDSIIKERVGLPLNWTPDEEIKNAIRFLKEDTTIIEEKLLNTIESNLQTNRELFEEVETNNKKVLEFLQKEVNELTTEQLSERKILIDNLKNDFRIMLGFINDLGSAFEKVKKLRIDLNQAKRKQGKELSTIETDRSFYQRNR